MVLRYGLARDKCEEIVIVLRDMDEKGMHGHRYIKELNGHTYIREYTGNKIGFGDYINDWDYDLAFKKNKHETFAQAPKDTGKITIGKEEVDVEDYEKALEFAREFYKFFQSQ